MIVVDGYKRLDPKLVSRKQRWLGERVANSTHMAGDKRCDYCGKWFSWSTQNMDKYILEKRWDFRRKEAIHCGSSHCWDYHMRWLKHVKKMRTDAAYQKANFIERKKREGMENEQAFSLYESLKAKGMVA